MPSLRFFQLLLKALCQAKLKRRFCRNPCFMEPAPLFQEKCPRGWKKFLSSRGLVALPTGTFKYVLTMLHGIIGFQASAGREALDLRGQGNWKNRPAKGFPKGTVNKNQCNKTKRLSDMPCCSRTVSIEVATFVSLVSRRLVSITPFDWLCFCGLVSMVLLQHM